MPDGLSWAWKKVAEAVRAMEPGEKMGLGFFALMGLCCGGLPVLIVAGPAIAGALSGSWPLALAAVAGVGLLAYRRHCRNCEVSDQNREEVRG